MRQKRAKAYRKLMALYSMTFGFRQPYQVLVDSEMCKAATELKLELVKQIVSVLQGEVKPMITQCCIHELYLQGITQQASVDLAKTFERRKCNHREPIAGDECISSVVGKPPLPYLQWDSNKHRYVIATQSQDLRVRLRSVPAVPIVHVNRSVMVLEPPSNITIQTKTRTEEQALHPSAPDLALIGRPSTSAEPAHKKRKGPKGPNPLSVKKKKVNPPIVDVQERAEVGQKRKCRSLESEIEETGEPRPAAGVVTAAVKRRKRRKKLAAKYLGLTASVSDN
ncbi:Fcf1-domain-containing protein [Infundibulicybe gibba]|nr:Fcf1-domain-containing protein [Infundibulicybe gibba]